VRDLSRIFTSFGCIQPIVNPDIGASGFWCGGELVSMRGSRSGSNDTRRFSKQVLQDARCLQIGHRELPETITANHYDLRVPAGQ
jgi:hypothetical protein